jgi:hypothetical protein
MIKEISCVVTHHFNDVQISGDEFVRLLKIVTWQEIPWFPMPGRTAWYVFGSQPLLGSTPEFKLKAAKLKGIGLWNPKNFHYSGIHGGEHLDDPVPPTTIDYEYTSLLPHVGFTDEGEFTIVYSEPTPYGGMRHSRAVREYNNAHRLLERGIPAIVPFLVIEYQDGYKFRGEALGAVISLSPEPSPNRMHPLHFGEDGLGLDDREYYSRVRESLGISGDPTNETTRLATIKVLARQVGKLNHDFSAAGLYRHSGGWDNLHYCIEQRKVFLTDLDSSRDINERPENVRPLYILRDLASALHKLINKLYYPTVLETYTFSNLLWYDPLYEMIAGYFPNALGQDVQRVSRSLWSYFFPHFFLLKRYRQPLLTDWSSERRKSYKMEEDLFYILAITSLYPLYCNSDLALLYPSYLSHEQLMKKAESYLCERFEHLSYLLL